MNAKKQHWDMLQESLACAAADAAIGRAVNKAMESAKGISPAMANSANVTANRVIGAKCITMQPDASITSAKGGEATVYEQGGVRVTTENNKPALVETYAFGRWVLHNVDTDEFKEAMACVAVDFIAKVKKAVIF